MFEFIKDKHESIVSMKGTTVYDRYQKVFQAHCNMKQRQEAALLQKIKVRYKREQPVIDIQQQLKELLSVEVKTAKMKDYIFVKCVQIIDTLFTFMTSSSEEEGKQQVKVINTLTILCCLQKGKHSHHSKPFTSHIKLEQDLTSLSVPQV